MGRSPLDTPGVRPGGRVQGSRLTGASGSGRAPPLTDLEREARFERVEAARQAHSQATHQIDILRLLGGGRVRSVMAHTGNWDPKRRTEGAYQALLTFENGVIASASYSGYGHFDSDTWMDQIGELGQPKRTQDYGAARKRLVDLAQDNQESALKARRNYGGDLYQPPAADTANDHQHFGPIIVSCEKADLRPTATGIEISGDTHRHFEPLPRPTVPRSEVIDELVDVVVHGKPALHDGAWARATTEVCLALLASAASQTSQTLSWQTGLHNR
jgi:phthalate 4,5-cis-dihydrodiol dehydrogenase